MTLAEPMVLIRGVVGLLAMAVLVVVVLAMVYEFGRARGYDEHRRRRDEIAEEFRPLRQEAEENVKRAYYNVGYVHGQLGRPHRYEAWARDAMASLAAQERQH